jgi:23S rRNA pseudouridine1911/1915/1917 synthase
MQPITVLFEDEDVLVLNKPAGIVVHPDGRTEGGTITDWVRIERPGMVGVGESMRLQNGTVIDRPGVVHRLDRDTSGILLLTKTQSAFLHIKSQFQQHRVEKMYHAFVWGEIKTMQGTIDRPIGRSRRDFRLWSATSSAGGQLRPAVTRYTVLATYDGFSYLALEPKTGRTHQLRVHLKAIGHPVVSDVRYAPQKPLALGFERHALHAQSLAFTHPSGAHMVLEAPLPNDFLGARQLFGV